MCTRSGWALCTAAYCEYSQYFKILYFGYCTRSGWDLCTAGYCEYSQYLKTLYFGYCHTRSFSRLNTVGYCCTSTMSGFCTAGTANDRRYFVRAASTRRIKMVYLISAVYSEYEVYSDHLCTVSIIEISFYCQQHARMVPRVGV